MLDGCCDAGYAPIHRACWGREKRHADTVAVFLKNGVDVNLLTKQGATPLELTSNHATKDVLLAANAKAHTDL